MKALQFLIPVVLIFVLYACDKEISVTPPDSPPDNGTIKIVTEPEGYSIHLNGRISGQTTPDSLFYLEYGQYEVHLVDSFYLDTTFVVNLENSNLHEYFIDMTEREEFYGALEVITDPEDAEVIIDDVPTGIKTPAMINNLYPGRHKIDFNLIGYRALSNYIDITSNDATSLRTFLSDTSQWVVYNKDNSNIPTNNFVSIAMNPASSNDLWIGSLDDGLLRLNSAGFTHYSDEDYKVPSNNIIDISIDDNGIVLAATPIGAAKYNGNNWNAVQPTNGFELNQINSVEMYNSDTQEVYFSTINEGLVVYKNDTYTKFTPSNFLFRTNDIAQIVREGNKRIVIGTRVDGIYMTSLYDTTDWNHYYHVNTYFQDVDRKCKISCLAIRPMWSDVYAGIDLADDKGQLFFYSDNLTDGVWKELNIGNPRVNSICIDGNLTWVGTNNGLFKFVNQQYLAEHYTPENSGLPSLNVNDIVVDSKRNVWLATDNGIVRFKNQGL